MNGSGRVIAMMAAVCMCTGGYVGAELVTIELTGEVTGLDDPVGWINSEVTVGQEISGWYSYDTSTPDSNPLARVGDYYHHSKPYGIELHIGDFVFQTDPADVEFLLAVGDNFMYSSWDNYGVGSYNNLPFSDEVYVTLIGWGLQDPSGTALSSALLPATPPDVTQWSAMNWLRIELGGNPDQSSAMIGGRVTSVSIVPEPATVLLLVMGGIALIRKKRRL
jgi:hypothetical protein